MVENPERYRIGERPRDAVEEEWKNEGRIRGA